MLASRDIDLCHVRTHPIWCEPVAGYRSWLMALNLHNGLLPMGQCHGQGTPLLTGQRFHFPQCHSGLVSSRNEHVCLYHDCRVTNKGNGWSTILQCWNCAMTYKQRCFLYVFCIHITQALRPIYLDAMHVFAVFQLLQHHYDINVKISLLHYNNKIEYGVSI